MLTMNARSNNFARFSCLYMSLILFSSGCGGESDQPSAADKALNELQTKYDELMQKQLDGAVQWAADDFENIGDWEYRIVELSYTSSEALEATLNNFGNERWEVFWVEKTDNGLLVLLKRPSLCYLCKIPLSQIGRFVIDGSGNE